MYDMSINMVGYGTVEEAIVNNCEHRTMLIDDMLNIDMVFLSGRDTDEERRS